MNSRWIAALLFWGMWLLSIALNSRYPWIDGVWLSLFLILAIAATVYFIADTILHPGKLRSVGGYPRWFIRFAMGEDESKNAQKIAVRNSSK